MVLYALVCLLLLPVRGFVLGAIAAVAERILWTVPRPSFVAGLQVEGDSVVILSFIEGIVRPLAAWNAWNVFLFLAVPLAFVLAAPLHPGASRVRRVASALATAAGAALSIAVVEVLLVAEAEASARAGLRLYPERLTTSLQGASHWLVVAATFVLPAGMFLHAWLQQETPAPVRTRRRGVAAALLAAGPGLVLLGANPPDQRSRLAALEHLRMLNPDSAHVPLALGVHQEEQGRLREAEALYREGMRLDGGLAAPVFGLGNALFRQGAYAEAGAAYRKVLALQPDHLPARRNLGIALFEQGRFEDAAASFAEVLRQDPRHAAAHHDLGAALLELHRECEALPHLRQGALLDRRFAGDLAMRARVARLQTTCAAN